MTNRTGKIAQGSHEYVIADGITACQMGNNLWTLFQDGRDTGIDCKTLAGARKYAAERGWKGAQ